MPVRSLSSSVLRWPDKEEVLRALRVWIKARLKDHPEMLKVGYFGSYSRGDWGVGSDLDLLVIVREAKRPFLERLIEWPVEGLPVPTDVFIYTEAEWKRMLQRSPWARGVEREVR